MGHESQNVQVAVPEESGVQIRMYLCDASGMFSQGQPSSRSQPSAPEQTDELQELQQATEELQQQNPGARSMQCAGTNAEGTSQRTTKS